MVKARDCDESRTGSPARTAPGPASRALIASATVVITLLTTVWLAMRLGTPGSPAPRAWWIHAGATMGATASLVSVLPCVRNRSSLRRRLTAGAIVVSVLVVAAPLWIEAGQLARDFGPPEGTAGAIALALVGTWVLVAGIAPLAWLFPRIPGRTVQSGDAVAVIGVGAGIAGVGWLLLIPRLVSVPDERSIDATAIDGAISQAEHHLAGARGPDGQLRYAIDARDGATQFDRYSLARHAGPTLVLCEHARSEAGLATARDATRFLLGHERHGDHDNIGHLTRRINARRFALSDQALPLVALARCRRRLGPWPALDRALPRLTRGLLAHQRDDGSLAAFRPEGGGVPRRAAFVDGQTLLAVIELRTLAVTIPALELDIPSLTKALRTMLAWTAQHDVRSGPDVLVSLEANWHCLAAARLLDPPLEELRDQLPPADIRALEDLCLRYVDQRRFASRYGVGLGPTSGERMRVGPTAVLAESIAAALKIRSARGDLSTLEPLRRDLETLVSVIAATQWRDGPARGGFPETPVDPYTRIDTTQHALAALAALEELRARPGPAWPGPRG